MSSRACSPKTSTALVPVEEPEALMRITSKLPAVNNSASAPTSWHESVSFTSSEWISSPEWNQPMISFIGRPFLPSPAPAVRPAKKAKQAAVIEYEDNMTSKEKSAFLCGTTLCAASQRRQGS